MSTMLTVVKDQFIKHTHTHTHPIPIDADIYLLDPLYESFPRQCDESVNKYLHPEVCVSIVSALNAPILAC